MDYGILPHHGISSISVLTTSHCQIAYLCQVVWRNVLVVFNKREMTNRFSINFDYLSVACKYKVANIFKYTFSPVK